MIEHQPVELAEVGEVLHRHQGPVLGVAGDDRLHVLDRAGRLRDRVRVGDAAAAVGAIDERLTLVRERVTRVHDAGVAEHDEGVAVGVRRSEVIEVDRFVAAEQRHPVRVGAVRQAVLVRGLLEHRHLLHVGAGVLVRDDLHARGEELVAAVVIPVRVGIDDVGDGAIGDRLDLVEDGLAVVGELGVDEHHTLGGDEHGGRPARARDLVQVVGDLRDRADTGSRGATAAALTLPGGRGGLLRTEPGGGGRDDSRHHDGCEYVHTLHVHLPS